MKLLISCKFTINTVKAYMNERADERAICKSCVVRNH